VSVKQAAEMLNVTPWSVYELLKDPACTLDARYFGKRRLVSLDSVRKFAASLPTERPEEASLPTERPEETA
jgi:hypothetical protein